MFSSRKMLLSLLLAASGAAAAGSLIPVASANTELDRRYALETIGYLRAWDNVDGLFGDYVDGALKEYFSRQSRFVLQDLSKSDPVLLKSKIPYYKIIDDEEILGRLARTFKVQSMIKTKITKEGPHYRVVMSWMHSPQMEVMSSETFQLKEPVEGYGFSKDDINKAFQEGLDHLIAKVPFQGTVTGRDQDAVTLNIGTTAGLDKGDTLVVGTLDDAKKHPLLKEIVDWRFSRTGKVLIDHVEDRIAFGKVVEEEKDRPISRSQKVIQIQKKPIQKVAPVVREKDEESSINDIPRLGWVSAGLMMLSYSRQFNDNTPIPNNLPAVARTGSGLFFGPKAEGQLWLTKDWFVDGGFSYGAWSYSQKDAATGDSTGVSASGTLNSFKIGVGYSYLITGDLFGPKGWLKLGYRTITYSLPSNDAEYTGPSSFKSPLIGIGADLPVRGQYGAFMNLEFGVFGSGKQNGVTIASGSAASSDVSFYLGGYYRYAPRINFRVGLDIQANGLDANSYSLSQKTITLLPSVQYYF